MSAFDIQWIDRGREPVCQPDPAYPDGIDVDGSLGAESACTVQLPYPAPRCGLHSVTCKICGHRVLITAAGRRDDPKSVKVACKSLVRA